MNVTAPQLRAEWIAGVVYVLLTVGLEYVPVFSRWWDEFKHKESALAAAGLLTTALTVAGHYATLYDLGLGPFTFEVARRAFNVWLAYLGGSWAIWSLADRAARRGATWGLPRKRGAPDGK